MSRTFTAVPRARREPARAQAVEERAKALKEERKQRGADQRKRREPDVVRCKADVAREADNSVLDEAAYKERAKNGPGGNLGGP